MAQIIAVKFDQVERVQKNATVSIPTHKEQLEARNTIFTARNRLTIDDAGAGPQLRHCLDNQRKASA